MGLMRWFFPQRGRLDVDGMSPLERWISFLDSNDFLDGAEGLRGRLMRAFQLQAEKTEGKSNDEEQESAPSEAPAAAAQATSSGAGESSGRLVMVQDNGGATPTDPATNGIAVATFARMMLNAVPFEELATLTRADDFQTLDFSIDLAEGATPHAAVVLNGSLSSDSLADDLDAILGPDELGMGEAALVWATSGDLAGKAFVMIEANGESGFQQGQDMLYGFPGHGAGVSASDPVPIAEVGI